MSCSLLPRAGGGLWRLTIGLRDTPEAPACAGEQNLYNTSKKARRFHRGFFGSSPQVGESQRCRRALKSRAIRRSSVLHTSSQKPLRAVSSLASAIAAASRALAAAEKPCAANSRSAVSSASLCCTHDPLQLSALSFTARKCRPSTGRAMQGEIIPYRGANRTIFCRFSSAARKTIPDCSPQPPF